MIENFNIKQEERLLNIEDILESIENYFVNISS